jgi:Fe2+ or Zn2+ uptake regulation protein
VSSQAPHAEVSARLGRARQRYTAGRRTLVELLHQAGRPLEIVELADGPARLPVSSIYRNLVVLEQAGAVTRYPGAGGGHAKYELFTVTDHRLELRGLCKRCG